MKLKDMTKQQTKEFILEYSKIIQDDDYCFIDFNFDVGTWANKMVQLIDRYIQLDTPEYKINFTIENY